MLGRSTRPPPGSAARHAQRVARSSGSSVVALPQQQQQHRARSTQRTVVALALESSGGGGGLNAAETHWPAQQQQQRHRGRRVVCRAGAADPQQQQMFSKFASQAYLDTAARRFRVGLENGLSEDELVAIELGAPNLDDLPEAQRPYVEKLKLRLAERGEQLRAEEAARRARELEWLERGKVAYERGEYPDAVAALERAADEAGRLSSVGGDALMWLALAYQAVGREADCIETYKWIEANHPLPKTRKQAENLRYIMEAPKLELSPDERVTIPLLNSQDVSWRRDGCVLRWFCFAS
jgi:tetratricopeptide (TPR) repeat protein